MATADHEAVSGRRLILHAPNVHTGGGAVLLHALLAASRAVSSIVLLVDARMPQLPTSDTHVEIHGFAPRIASRLAAEIKLKALARKNDMVLAFGNLPPLFRLPAETALFLQNRYLVDPDMPIHAFGKGARLRISGERIWLRRRLSNVDRILVQTNSMAELVARHLGRKAQVMPFDPSFDEDAAGAGSTLAAETKLYDFVYVASGEPHKNHLGLLKAWELLAEGGETPGLALTLARDRSPDLASLIDDINARQGTKITNLGNLSSKDIEKLYRQSGALIFPSLGESFGLPLIEATRYGLPILASELDYVRDLIEPTTTFDPRSSRSIARAVRRFLQLPPALDRRLSADEFMQRVCAPES